MDNSNLTTNTGGINNITNSGATIINNAVSNNVNGSINNSFQPREKSVKSTNDIKLREEQFIQLMMDNFIKYDSEGIYTYDDNRIIELYAYDTQFNQLIRNPMIDRLHPWDYLTDRVMDAAIITFASYFRNIAVYQHNLLEKQSSEIQLLNYIIDSKSCSTIKELCSLEIDSEIKDNLMVIDKDK